MQYTIKPSILVESSLILFQKFFCLVDFGSQVWTPSSIRMIQQHELTMVFPNFVFCKRPLARDVKHESANAAMFFEGEKKREIRT